jgi:glycosyltransferase involved in cell wall biosynthesis
MATLQRTDLAPLVSVVVPCYNEDATLPELYRELDRVFGTLSERLEVVLVDDGSTDRTREIIQELVESDGRVRGVIFSRNFGHEAGIQAGIAEARGDAVIVMDADLQDSPDALPLLIAAWCDGADVAYAVRLARKENAFLRMAFSGFYRFAGRTMNIDLPRDAGPFCLMSRRAVDALKSLSEHGRYFPGLRAFIGFRQVAVPVERQARFAGETKYPLKKRISLGVEAIFSFSSAPLRLVTGLGIASSLVSVIAGTFIVIASLGGIYVVPGWTSLITVVLLIAGVQLLTLGIVGEYVGKVYDEVRDRPKYVVAETLASRVSDN